MPRKMKREGGMRKDSWPVGCDLREVAWRPPLFVFNNLRVVLLGFGDFLYFCGWRWPG